MTSPAAIFSCAQCHVRMESAQRCAACPNSSTHYCSRKCQVAHWNTHKLFCERSQKGMIGEELFLARGTRVVNLEPLLTPIDPPGSQGDPPSDDPEPDIVDSKKELRDGLDRVRKFEELRPKLRADDNAAFREALKARVDSLVGDEAALHRQRQVQLIAEVEAESDEARGVIDAALAGFQKQLAETRESLGDSDRDKWAAELSALDAVLGDSDSGLFTKLRRMLLQQVTASATTGNATDLVREKYTEVTSVLLAVAQRVGAMPLAAGSTKSTKSLDEQTYYPIDAKYGKNVARLRTEEPEEGDGQFEKLQFLHFEAIRKAGKSRLQQDSSLAAILFELQAEIDASTSAVSTSAALQEEFEANTLDARVQLERQVKLFDDPMAKAALQALDETSRLFEAARQDEEDNEAEQATSKQQFEDLQVAIKWVTRMDEEFSKISGTPAQPPTPDPVPAAAQKEAKAVEEEKVPDAKKAVDAGAAARKAIIDAASGAAGDIVRRTLTVPPVASQVVSTIAGGERASQSGGAGGSASPYIGVNGDGSSSGAPPSRALRSFNAAYLDTKKESAVNGENDVSFLRALLDAIVAESGDINATFDTLSETAQLIVHQVMLMEQMERAKNQNVPTVVAERIAQMLDTAIDGSGGGAIGVPDVARVARELAIETLGNNAASTLTDNALLRMARSAVRSVLGYRLKKSKIMTVALIGVVMSMMAPGAEAFVPSLGIGGAAYNGLSSAFGSNGGGGSFGLLGAAAAPMPPSQVVQGLVGNMTPTLNRTVPMYDPTSTKKEFLASVNAPNRATAHETLRDNPVVDHIVRNQTVKRVLDFLEVFSAEFKAGAKITDALLQTLAPDQETSKAMYSGIEKLGAHAAQLVANDGGVNKLNLSQLKELQLRTETICQDVRESLEVLERSQVASPPLSIEAIDKDELVKFHGSVNALLANSRDLTSPEVVDDADENDQTLGTVGRQRVAALLKSHVDTSAKFVSDVKAEIERGTAVIEARIAEAVAAVEAQLQEASGGQSNDNNDDDEMHPQDERPVNVARNAMLTQMLRRLAIGNGGGAANDLPPHLQVPQRDVAGQWPCSVEEHTDQMLALLMRGAQLHSERTVQGATSTAPEIQQGPMSVSPQMAIESQVQLDALKEGDETTQEALHVVNEMKFASVNWSLVGNLVTAGAAIAAILGKSGNGETRLARDISTTAAVMRARAARAAIRQDSRFAALERVQQALLKLASESGEETQENIRASLVDFKLQQRRSAMSLTGAYITDDLSWSSLMARRATTVATTALSTLIATTVLPNAVWANAFDSILIPEAVAEYFNLQPGILGMGMAVTLSLGSETGRRYIFAGVRRARHRAVRLMKSIPLENQFYALRPATTRTTTPDGEVETYKQLKARALANVTPNTTALSNAIIPIIFGVLWIALFTTPLASYFMPPQDNTDPSARLQNANNAQNLIAALLLSTVYAVMNE